jgi:hypothetical protein
MTTVGRSPQHSAAQATMNMAWEEQQQPDATLAADSSRQPLLQLQRRSTSSKPATSSKQATSSSQLPTASLLPLPATTLT